MTQIDLNADLGESFSRWRLGDDEALLTVITSANVACGFHAGDPTVIRQTCRRAAECGVVIGAQVGYRDLPGFGRRFIDVAPEELVNDIVYQVGALAALAAAEGTSVRYVKPHGALYNAIVAHEEQAAAVVEAVRLVDPGLPVLGLPGSRWLELAGAAGLRAVPEAFADRAYTPQGTLVSRRQPGAVIEDAAQIAERSVRFATEQKVTAVDGTDVAVRARSLCVHGDTAGAVGIARSVRSALERAGVEIVPFAAGDGA